MIEPVHADHRRTIFWQGLKDAVVAKDIDTALRVRERFQRERKKQAPLIFTLDGHYWNSSGMLINAKKNPRLLQHPPFMFGEKEPTSTQEYQGIQRQLEDCEQARKHLTSLLWLDEEVRGMNVDELQEKINAELELNLGV